MGHNLRAEGKGFESAFKVMANLCGFKVIKIPEMGVWIDGNTFKPIAGWSDFMLVGQDSRTAFVDTKTTLEPTFPFSRINTSQVDFFQSVGDLCPAGYVVNFVAFNTVVFFDWRKLRDLRSGESLCLEDGLILGKIPILRVQEIMGTVTRGAVA